MSNIIDYDPWHGDPGNAIAPHRPSLAQLGGGAYEDDQSDPPDLDTMPSAAMENVNEKVLAGIARLSTVMRVSVEFIAGAPSIHSVAFADSTLDATDLTITDNGLGYTDITWAADTFPVSATRPYGLTMNEETAASRTSAVAIANGIRVKTIDEAGIGVDTAFTVELG